MILAFEKGSLLREGTYLKAEKSERSKVAEGRTSKIKPDIYERVKKDAKYKKMTVDQYLDVLLRRELFQEKKRPRAGKKDFLGYCPNCSSKVKLSTLKSEAPSDTSVPATPDGGEGFFQKFFGKKDGVN